MTTLDTLRKETRKAELSDLEDGWAPHIIEEAKKLAIGKGGKSDGSLLETKTYKAWSALHACENAEYESMMAGGGNRR